MVTVLGGRTPVHIVEGTPGRRAFAIRDYLARSEIPFTTTTTSDGAHLSDTSAVVPQGAQLPVVLFADGTQLADPTPADIARHLGWIKSPTRTDYDLLIYGAGPAGLSAAVYAASEGLNVAVIERDAVGGQAGFSSLIENYLGFADGIAGAELADRARTQAVQFGAELLLMREGVSRSFHDHHIDARLADGSSLTAKAGICATGIRWRRLGLPGEQRLAGAGVYYGAGTSEAAACAGEHVYIVGGANSAGQAAMNLSAHADRVTMLVRGPSLSATMSTYLLRRVLAQPNIVVLTDTHVAALSGADELEGLTLSDGGRRQEVPARRLFICIGGSPNTAWAEGTRIRRDEAGFIITGPDLGDPTRTDWPLARAPHFLESSVPGVFAAGDVRSHSVKRVASAVGEGAMAVMFVQRYLVETFG